MSVNHIVLFKFKENTSKETIDSLYKNFLNIKDEIPGIISITGGSNISTEDKSKGYHMVFLITFESTKDRDNYLPHFKHQSLVEKHISPIIEDVLVFDYEII